VKTNAAPCTLAEPAPRTAQTTVPYACDPLNQPAFDVTLVHSTHAPLLQTMTTKAKAAGHAHRPQKTKKGRVTKAAAKVVRLATCGAEDAAPSTSGGGGRPSRPAAAAPDLDEADAIAATAGAALPVPAWADGLLDFRNRERVLILSTRGITHR